MRTRWAMLRALLAACGAPPILGVAAGGCSIAYAIWRAQPAPSPILLAAIAPLVTLLALFAWLWSCALVASRTAIDLVRLLRYDAIAYAWLLVYPILTLAHAPSDAAPAAALGFLCATAGVLARFRPGFRAALLVFVLSRVVVAAIAETTAAFVGYRGVRGTATSELLAVWARWDGMHYLSIAYGGYRGSNLAFFPLYPLCIRLVAVVAGSPIVAALIVSNVSFLAALVALRRLVADMYDDALAGRTIYYLATFPTAVFFSAVYTESLFLALSVLTFASLRKGRWLGAGFAGGLAALTRVEGILLLVPYAVEAFARRDARHDPRIRTSRRDAAFYGAAMIALGLLTFMLLSALLSGDPFYFLHVQSHWRREISWPWTSFARSARLIVTSHDAPTVAVQITQFAFFAFAVTLAIRGLRRLPVSFSAYTVASLLVPLLTGSLMSGQRFAIVLFPLFIMLAIDGTRPTVDLVWRTLALPLLGAFTVLFAGGFWVG